MNEITYTSEDGHVLNLADYIVKLLKHLKTLPLEDQRKQIEEIKAIIEENEPTL